MKHGMQDINENAASDLNEEHIFENLVQHACEGIYRSSPSPTGHFLFANPALAHIFGCEDVADFLATYPDIQHHFYVDPLTREDVTERLHQYGVVRSYECRGRRKDGSTFWMLENARAVRDRDGAVIGYEGFIQDITQRKAVEKRHRLVIKGSNEGIWEWWSSTPEAYYVSDRFQEIVNIAVHENELRLSLWRDRIHPDDLEHHDREVDDFFRGHRSTSAVEYRVRGDDGEYRWVLDRGCAERDQDQQIVHMAGSLGDVTAERNAREILEESNQRLQQAKEAAEAADRAKSALLATMSHELRTPLNAIIGFAEILAEERLGPHATRQYAEYSNDIYQSASLLLSIVNEMLDMAKVESGGAELAFDWWDVNEIVNDAYRIIVPQADKKDIALQIDRTNPMILYGDRRRLQQVFLNVMANAVKFTPEGGRVTVSLEQTSRNITVNICDTGEGMEPEEIPLAFQAFCNLQSKTTREHSGCGIGLALADKLTQMHDGSIDVNSAPGSGTKVRIHLPRPEID